MWFLCLLYPGTMANGDHTKEQTPLYSLANWLYWAVAPVCRHRSLWLHNDEYLWGPTLGLPLPVFYCWHHYCQFSSVQPLSCVSLWPHWLQHARLPCPSRTPRACSLMSIELVMPSNHLILSFPSPPAFNPSQRQGLLQWVSSSHQVTKVLEFQLQLQSFQWMLRTDLL